MSHRRRATVRVALDDPAAVAAAVRPDDTPDIDTRAEDGAVVVALGRDTTGGLRATVDDVLVNLDVADRTARAATAQFDPSDDTPDQPPADTDYTPKHTNYDHE